MDIDPTLLKIIALELGSSSADLFVKFYHGFSVEEQVSGAKSILRIIIGYERTEEILKELDNKK